MNAEHPSRLEVIQSALTISREMVAAGPTEEIPLFAIEGLADTSIPQLEQLEIREEYATNPDGESVPLIDKINTQFRREVYQQLYSSAQRGILPTRDALVFALFIDDLNYGMNKREAVEITSDNIVSLRSTLGKNGVELISRAGHKGVYYDLPKFYKEAAEISPELTPEPQTETEKPQLANFFPGIPNKEISLFVLRTREGTAAHAYVQYIAGSLDKGVFPTEDEIKKHFLEAGFTSKHYENSKAYLSFRFREIAFARGVIQQSTDEPNPSEEPTTTKIESYFKGIPNDDLPNPDDVFRPNTLSHKYFDFVIMKLKDGAYPSPNEIKKYLADSGAQVEHFEQIRTTVEKKVREALGPTFDSWKSGREIVNGYPVITAPERKQPQEPAPKQSVEDGMLRASIQFMRPDLKVAAATIFDRTAGKSISETDWINRIQKEHPDKNIGPADLPNLIKEMREDGNIKVISVVSEGVTYYYRRSDNINRI